MTAREDTEQNQDAAAGQARIDAFAACFRQVKAAVGRLIVGQEQVIEQVLTGLFAGGHVLLEGLPGLGKTSLVKALAAALSLDFRRIQFTPDLMPADIIGTTILQETEQGRRFEFQPGPIFGHLVLTDEINRATPKTQAALLEAMQEGSVTVSGTTHVLDQPFFVLATQNPIELEGTYPLPEAQLDRFFLKLHVAMVNEEELAQVLDLTTGQTPATLEPVATRDEVLEHRAWARRLPASRAIKTYAARLVLATHPAHPTAAKQARSYLKFGASPRGAQALLLGAKVRAMADGRANVAFEDLRSLALPVLRHRLILNFDGEASGVTTDQVLEDVLETVPEPA
jgi:MoxR-like ATPase